MIALQEGRITRLTDLPEFNVVIFAVLLNYPWEFLQAPLYEGMATADHWDAVKICTGAALGDGVIMLTAFWAVAAVSRNRWWFLRPDRRQIASFVAVGVAVTILLERLATMSVHPDWGWTYADAMPLLPGTGVGLSPLLQWIILPPLAIWFVRRQLETRAPQLRSDHEQAA